MAVPSDGQVAHMYGRVTDAATGKPVANATIDVWQASTNGLYEQQDSDQPDHNLRGRFRTDGEGMYSFECLRPTPYPVPGDGPAGKLLDLLDRHHYRPGHIHFIVTAEGHKTVTTQLFDRESRYLDDDSVFAVKPDLLVDFVRCKTESRTPWELEYNIAVAALDG